MVDGLTVIICGLSVTTMIEVSASCDSNTGVVINGLSGAFPCADLVIVMNDV